MGEYDSMGDKEEEDVENEEEGVDGPVAVADDRRHGVRTLLDLSRRLTGRKYQKI